MPPQFWRPSILCTLNILSPTNPDISSPWTITWTWGSVHLQGGLRGAEGGPTADWLRISQPGCPAVYGNGEAAHVQGWLQQPGRAEQGPLVGFSSLHPLTFKAPQISTVSTSCTTVMRKLGVCISSFRSCPWAGSLQPKVEKG